MTSSLPDVRNLPERSRFELELDGEVAVLVYELHGDDQVALTHTVVPAAHEGKGVGSALVVAALDWAVAEGRTVVPVCTFVQSWLARHPERADVVAGQP